MLWKVAPKEQRERDYLPLRHLPAEPRRRDDDRPDES